MNKEGGSTPIYDEIEPAYDINFQHTRYYCSICPFPLKKRQQIIFKIVSYKLFILCGPH